MPMLSVTCVHDYSTSKPFSNIGINVITQSTSLMPSSLGRQVSRGNTNDEVVAHYCNFSYVSKQGQVTLLCT